MNNTLKKEFQTYFNVIKKETLNSCPITEIGKLIRSKIALLLLRACNIHPSGEYLNIIIAGELIHSASLLHDDVIDNEEKRRNSPTLRKIYDNKTSILYGNMTLTNAIEKIVSLNSVELIKIYNKAIKNMCEGELLQKNSEFKIPDLEEYLKKNELKTASLFSSIISALSVFSDNSLPQKYKDFGKYFGTAFQIKNDLEDILKNKSDIKNGIYTAPVIYSNSVDITKDSIEKTYGLIDNYSQRAIEVINDLEESKYKETLVEVVKCLKK